ncbi:helix-turn-helix transcriptional regulator [Brevundimonas aveniformis]|uniref:helix-turn-helix transcriptional regulator n=1 Tax=Brevundimonas aveniformis TaxID=370977 RepID=UPI0024908C5D|nr:AraC family transcriptional regulator [Brevundimonas aveniformis]
MAPASVPHSPTADDRRPLALRPFDRLGVQAVIATASFVAYILARVFEGPAAMALAAFGVSACGWAWLVTRALFDPARHDAVWPRLVVGVLTATGAMSVLAPEGMARDVASNLYALSGSAALLLTVIEPFQRHGCGLAPGEVRFRAAFVIGFAGLAGVSVLGVWLDPAPIQTVSAALSLIALAAAVIWRRGHPLQAPAPAPRRAATEDEVEIGGRLMALLEAEAIHTDPDLRIADVAARLNVPEHRLSRGVAALGFANFNRLINHHRIEQAKAMLTAPGPARPILLIALDCGFASVGPFNRAFKAETGVTPRAFRAGV